MQTKQVNSTRLLPKTGQEVPVFDFDDGYYHAGWWKGLTYDANKTRFVAKTIDGDDVVIDNATGLMWAADGNRAGCNNGATISWLAAIPYANALDFAGFTDWRLPNINELLSLVNHGIYDACIDEPPFSNTKDLKYWTSTANQTPVANTKTVHFSYGLVSDEGYIATNYIRCVRGGL